MVKEGNYLAGFGAFPKISTEIWQKLTGYFPNYEKAWGAGISDFIKSGVKETTAKELYDFIKENDPEKIYNELQKNKIELVSFTDSRYPKNLKEIFSPPFLLYIKGELKESDEFAIAIVGARKCTDYGKRATRDIAEGIAAAGVTIVSGLALGLDAEAHTAALKESSRTIAVLANGLDDVYPASNLALAEKIIENGALVSEQPLGMPPLKQNFPARNRIISGLSMGVLVTEATDKSGTLHTANFALEQGRQIYAVPGPIYNPMSAGPNNLIKMGAKPVSCAADILEDFGIDNQVQEKSLPENPDEVMIFEILATEPKHVDSITAESGRPSHEISQIITMMEIKGKIKHLGGMVYCLK